MKAHDKTTQESIQWERCSEALTAALLTIPFLSMMMIAIPFTNLSIRNMHTKYCYMYDFGKPGPPLRYAVPTKYTIPDASKAILLDILSRQLKHRTVQTFCCQRLIRAHKCHLLKTLWSLHQTLCKNVVVSVIL